MLAGLFNLTDLRELQTVLARGTKYEVHSSPRKEGNGTQTPELGAARKWNCFTPTGELGVVVRTHDPTTGMGSRRVGIQGQPEYIESMRPAWAIRIHC